MIAMIAMAPLITLQILGLIFKYMENKKTRLDREHLALEQPASEELSARKPDPAKNDGSADDGGKNAAPERG